MLEMEDFPQTNPPTTFIILIKVLETLEKCEVKGTVFFNKYVILWLCLQLRQKSCLHFTNFIFAISSLGASKKEIKPSMILKVIFVAMLHERLQILFGFSAVFCGFLKV